jgi:flagellar hook-associated protein 2
VTTYAATSSDGTSVSAAATSQALPGRYEVIVNQLARAQVTVSTSTSPNVDTALVADGGTLTISGVTVTASGPVTLSQLAAAINSTPDIPVTASLVQTAPGAYRLLLTSRDTGSAGAFAVSNALTGSTIAFADANGDGVSGNSAADNAVSASDASLLINNLPVTSASNTVDGAIPGVTLTLGQQDPAKTVSVTVARDDQSLADRVSTFVSAYNDLVAFAADQASAARNGTAGTLARDPVLRALRSSLRTALSAAYGSGDYVALSQVGLGFTRDGRVTFDPQALSTALLNDPPAVEKLFTGTSGAFGSVNSLIDEYTRAGGLVPGARAHVSDGMQRIQKSIDDLQARLATRRATLQREFVAADQAMAALNAQTGSLASFGSALSKASL